MGACVRACVRTDRCPVLRIPVHNTVWERHFVVSLYVALHDHQTNYQLVNAHLTHPRDPHHAVQMFMKLPFAEDLREFEFAALDASAAAPTAAQLDAAENLIMGMSVGDEWAPENVRNPALQRLHNSLQARAVDPNCPLDLDSESNTALMGRVLAQQERSKVQDALGTYYYDYHCCCSRQRNPTHVP